MKTKYFFKEHPQTIKQHLTKDDELRTKFYVSSLKNEDTKIIVLILSVGITKSCIELTEFTEKSIQQNSQLTHLGGGYLIKREDTLVFAGSCKQNGAVPPDVIKSFESEIKSSLELKEISTEIAEHYIKTEHWEGIL